MREAQQVYLPIIVLAELYFGAEKSPDLVPLERVQIDHTKVDVIVVDEVDRLPIGRPWLTLAIDLASRVVLGFSVSLEGPSAVSVALTLAQAVLPKDLWFADRQLEVPWPMWGLPEPAQDPSLRCGLYRTSAPESRDQIEPVAQWWDDAIFWRLSF